MGAPKWPPPDVRSGPAQPGRSSEPNTPGAPRQIVILPILRQGSGNNEGACPATRALRRRLSVSRLGGALPAVGGLIADVAGARGIDEGRPVVREARRDGRRAFGTHGCRGGPGKQITLARRIVRRRLHGRDVAVVPGLFAC